MTRPPVTPLDDAALADVVAERGHWCASQNSARDGDFVCECGLPWTPVEGCAFAQGARLLLDRLTAAEAALARAWDEGWKAAVQSPYTAPGGRPEDVNPYRAALAASPSGSNERAEP